MVKELERLKKTLRNTVGYLSIAGALSFGYFGCPSPIEPPLQENRKPIASIVASPTSGYAPLSVMLDAGASKDFDGDFLKFTYLPKFPKDTISLTGPNKINYVYSDTGKYRPKVVVEDSHGARDTASVLEDIVVGKAPNQKPIAQFTATPKSGYAPLTVSFNGIASSDNDGSVSKWYWDFNNDDAVDDSSGANVSYIYQTPGNYTASLRVRDNEGALSDKKLENIVVRQAPYGQIAFRSRRNGSDDIYKGDLIKTISGKDTLINITRLTTDSRQDLEPAWSPDGKYLVFTSTRTGKIAVWKMDENGNNQTDISSHLVERAMRADWNPNGKIVVAYTDSNSTKAGIGIIDENGTSFTPIYTITAKANAPAEPNPTWPKWSPDGTKIVFVQNFNNQICIINADGTGPENIIDNSGQPYWVSNDELIFISDKLPDNNGSLDIYKINIITKEVTRVTDDSGHEVDPIISADRTKIVFTHDVDLSNPQIYVMNADGTNWTQLTFEGSSRYPAWRPKP